MLPSEALAAEAALHYVSDAETPGYTRRRQGKGFVFVDPKGRPVRDAATRARLAALVIPPAWTDVWIAPSPRAHLQATGVDARGRKQYIYHQDWVSARDRSKFDRMIAFGRALPTIRRRVARDLNSPPLSRARVLAVVVDLLDQTLIRVGSESYARENGTYGLTTLRDRHARADADGLVLEFRGKNGTPHRVKVGDRRLARIVRECQELPGQQLFQYLDDAGARHDVTSADVNAYLHEIAGGDFTAKDFRTWRATVHAACTLCAVGCSATPTAAKRTVNAAVKEVAAALRNTAAVCRKSYIHPAVIDAYLGGELTFDVPAVRRPRARYGLGADERAVLAWLRKGGRTRKATLKSS